MGERQFRPLTLQAGIERWPLAAPFRIAGYTFDHIDVLVVGLEHNGCIGRGEAAGVYYLNDTPAIMLSRVQALRSTIGVDANQGFTTAFFEQLMPVLIQARVSLIEQPFAVGEEALLERVESPIPIAADESVQCLTDMQRFSSLFDVVNIKLDKCGGLTEGLEMARRARELGLEPMVGNMIGTSLAMAPAFVVGQLCEVVDLDGPVFLKSDRAPHVIYDNGLINCPSGLWGGLRES